MQNDMVTVSQMVDTATSYYALNPSKASKRATREAIVRDLQKQGVWDQNIKVVGSKREVHYFDQNTFTHTIYTRLKNYFKKRASDAWRLAEEMSEEYRKHMDYIPTEDELKFEVPTVSYNRTEFDVKLHDIMIQALFEKFFNLDTDRLEHDLLVAQYADNDYLSPEQAVAKKNTSSFKAIFENYISEK